MQPSFAAATPSLLSRHLGKVLVAIVLTLGLAVFAFVHAPFAHAANNYYVATNGSDANDGASATQSGSSGPFQTIQKCASVAQAGDTCFIRGGTYRETVTPAHSGTANAPITFAPYNGENVTVSGADLLTGWSLDHGSVYTTPMSWDLGRGNNQIFVDGQMMIEARWPNTGLDLSHPTLAKVGSGTGNIANATINDTNLTQPSGYWVGASIVIGSTEGVAQGVVAKSGTVTSSAVGQLSFTYDYQDYGDPPAPGATYYLLGLANQLDSATEWYRDSSTSQLSLWAPQSDSPANHTVEAKHRTFAFDLSERSYITLQGLHLFAASVNTSSNSQHCVLDGLSVQYVSHYSLITADAYLVHVLDTGIILNGSYNTLENSEIAWSAGNGVLIQGSYNTVTNNYIHDVNYAGTDTAAVDTGDENDTQTNQTIGHTITYNTLVNSGRGLIVHRTLAAGKIMHNDLSGACLQRTDCGATYAWRDDGAYNGTWTEVAYNQVHDDPSPTGGGSDVKAALYLDGLTNYVYDHNVTWNVDRGFQLNYHPTRANYRKVYNNTIVSTGTGTNACCNSDNNDASHVEIKNNIFTQSIDGAGVQQNNLASTTDPKFLNAAIRDYELQPSSPAVDAGLVLSPYTDNYAGTAPDIGAYESSQPMWPVGSTLAPRSAQRVVQAESYSSQSGVINYGSYIGNLDNGDYTCYTNIDFGAGVTTFQARIGVPAQYAGQRIELHLDGTGGTPIGTLTTQSTGDWSIYSTQSVSVANTTGVHTLCLVISGSYGAGNLDWFAFTSTRAATSQIEAESYDTQSGVVNYGTYIGNLDNGDYACYNNIDFGSGVATFQARLGVPAQYAGQHIEVHLDGTGGTPIGTLTTQSTGDWSIYSTQSVSVTSITGVHTLCLVIAGSYGAGNLDWIKFTV